VRSTHVSKTLRPNAKRFTLCVLPGLHLESRRRRDVGKQSLRVDDRDAPRAILPEVVGEDENREGARSGGDLEEGGGPVGAGAVGVAEEHLGGDLDVGDGSIADVEQPEAGLARVVEDGAAAHGHPEGDVLDVQILHASR